MRKNKALFLDRDGVINYEKNYIYKIEDFKFIDGVFDTCRAFQKAGYKIFVISNQSGIARGYYTEDQYRTLSIWMVEQFAKMKVFLTGVYHCPHHPDITGECNCRKPKTGMIDQAVKEHNIDLSQSFIVGDKDCDIQAGINAGIPYRFLVQTGHKTKHDPSKAVLVRSIASLTAHIK